MIGVVLGTGPSLADVAGEIRKLRREGRILLFGVNNTFEDFDLDVWIACDPAWHSHYGQVSGNFAKWHWSREICDKFGYKYIEGRWADGLSPVGSNWISLNHGSGPQALNLATSVYCCEKVLLVGHDMCYREGKPRHYFNISDTRGEYPQPLRKYSQFEKPKRDGGAHPDGDGILYNYKHIAEQKWLPPIINCTPDSAMTWFPIMKLSDAL
jgi:hypothetical protein